MSVSQGTSTTTPQIVLIDALPLHNSQLWLLLPPLLLPLLLGKRLLRSCRRLLLTGRYGEPLSN